MPENLGFIGLGSMGEPIAANLLAAGYALRVYNRTAAKAAHLAAKGATVAPTAADVASPGGIVLTMLSDDRALEAVCLAQPSFVEKLGSEGIHVSLSTISPATARRLAEHHAKYKVDYVASPVFGRPEAAAAKRLAIPFSGPAAAKKRIEPILAAISASHFDYGEDPGCANVVKLCGNFLVASAIESLAETLTLAEKNGVDKLWKANCRAKIRTARLQTRPGFQRYQSRPGNSGGGLHSDAPREFTARPLALGRRQRSPGRGLGRDIHRRSRRRRFEIGTTK